MPKRVQTDDTPKWKVLYPKVNHSGKLSKAEQELVDIAALQISPFHGKGQPATALDIHYVVKPQDEWAAMKRYNSFVIAGDHYSNSEYVFVRHDGVKDGDSDKADCKDYWVAKILEVRASDSSHVYARVFWLYWPEELPKTNDGVSSASGRRPYHGKHELIASNWMEILDVTSFAGKAAVEHWLEEDVEDGKEDVQMDLYWRQTFDHRTWKLSGQDLRRHCICKSFYNPDKKMYGCPSEKCRLWLHTDCLLQDICSRTYERMKSDSSDGSFPTRVPKSKKRKVDEIMTYDDIFSATIVDGEGEGAPKFLITDHRPDTPSEKKTLTEDIHCLKCRTTIE